MEVLQGSVVRSKAGRDKGMDFIVLAIENEYVYIADGKLRKTDNPKKKKLKHIQVTGKISELIAEKLRKNKNPENFEVRKALAELGGYNIG